ncbi:MAG: SDR family oxidoreductase [Pseudomonadota bacterium]
MSSTPINTAAAPHAIVTGGSSGIGRAVAERLAGQGFSLTLIARRTELLERAKNELEKGGGTVGVATADVADEANLSNVIDAAQALRGPCHTLIACAGAVVPGRFENLNDATFRRLMDVNYLGSVNAVRAVYGGMTERRAGRIGLVASAAALIGIFGYTAYAGSKFALRGFAEALRGEAKAHGLCVTICYPGDTDTDQYAAETSQRPAETQAIAGAAPLADPKRVAEAFVRGMDRGRFAVYPGLEVAALGRTASFISPLLNARFDSLVSRFAKR